MLRVLLIIKLWMSYFRLVFNYVAALLLSLGPCGALSLCGMCMMEFHFPWVGMIFCGSGVRVFLSVWLLGVRGVWVLFVSFRL